MDLDYSVPGKVEISMIKYLHKIIQGFPEVIKGSAVTPVVDHLFQVRENWDAKLLPR